MAVAVVEDAEVEVHPAPTFPHALVVENEEGSVDEDEGVADEQPDEDAEQVEQDDGGAGEEEFEQKLGHHLEGQELEQIDGVAVDGVGLLTVVGEEQFGED